MPLKVVTIDFWNTIFDSSNGQLRNAYRLRSLVTEIDKHGILVKHDQFDEAMRASWEQFNTIWKSEMRTPLPFETAQFFWNYLNLPYIQDSIENIADAFAHSILVHPPSLIEGVRAALKHLAGKYTLAIVSDTGFSPGIILRQLLEKKSIIDKFDTFSFSDETGVAKPHPKAYHTVLDRIGCPPAQAIHIGDIEDTDIFGAKSIGMKAILFKGDPTGELNQPRSTSTAADAVANSWSEVYGIISRLDR